MARRSGDMSMVTGANRAETGQKPRVMEAGKRAHTGPRVGAKTDKPRARRSRGLARTSPTGGCRGSFGGWRVLGRGVEQQLVDADAGRSAAHQAHRRLLDGRRAGLERQ